MSDEPQKGRFENNRFCPIRDCFKIRNLLLQAWNKNYMTHQSIAEDAEKFKRKGITRDAISRYVTSFDEKTGLVKPGRENRLTMENILWLCHRWGVVVKLEVHGLTGLWNPKTLIERADKFDLNNIYKKE